jgi:hypothetical protein
VSDPTRESLHGVALYNPHLLSKDELKRDFVARRAQFDSLVADLRSRTTSTPQHHLILGQRGMGKSTLLRRIAYEIQDDAELNAAYIPLLFPEEQYNIKHLGDLWLNCLDALSDALEAEGNKQQSDALDAAIESAHRSSPGDLEDAARTVLFTSAKRLGRRLVLLLDNADVVFDRIKEADWALRDAISKSDALVLIGASSNAIEHTHRYGQAFYDFFRVTRLGGLQDEEARDVLLALADRQGNEEVRRIVVETPERVAAVRTLAGGNPRTIATLYGILAASTHGDVRGDLEMLLDRHTPLYKARFEVLPDQAQQVVDALCILWDPARASDVAEHVGLELNKVSAQLDRLVTDGIVEKVLSVDKKTGRRSKRHAFQISERFFNIWYLMRASRRVRRKLIWLVRFLESMHGKRGLTQEASRIMRVLGGGLPSAHDVELALSLLERLPNNNMKTGLLWELARSRSVESDSIANRVENTDVYSLRIVDRATKVRWVRERFEALLTERSANHSQDLSSHNVSKFIRQTVDEFMMNPALLWVHKIELVKSIDSVDGPGSMLLLVQLAMDTFFDQCAVPSIERGMRVDDDPVMQLVSEGWDIEAPEFERILAARGRSNTRGLREWRESLDDMRFVTWVYGFLSVAGDPCVLREGEIVSQVGYVDMVVEQIVDVSRRRFAWVVPRVLLLVAKHDSLAADAEIRLLSGGGAAITRSAVDALLRFAVCWDRAALVRDRLDRTGLAEQWLPIRHALHAIVLGTRDVLDGLAPEVREPAATYFDEWAALAPSSSRVPSI